MSTGCDIEELVTVLEARLPSRAIRHVAGAMGIDPADLQARGIDDASSSDMLGRACDVRKLIRSAVEVVLLMNIGELSTGEAFALVDAEFRGEHNPLTQAAATLLQEQLE